MFSPAFSSPSPFRSSALQSALGGGGRTSAAALEREEERVRQLRTDNRALSALSQTHDERLREMLQARTGLEAECARALEMTKDSAVEKRALEQALRLAEQSLAGERCSGAHASAAFAAAVRSAVFLSRMSGLARITARRHTLAPRHNMGRPRMLACFLCAGGIGWRVGEG